MSAVASRTHMLGEEARQYQTQLFTVVVSNDVLDISDGLGILL